MAKDLFQSATGTQKLLGPTLKFPQDPPGAVFLFYVHT